MRNGINLQKRVNNFQETVTDPIDLKIGKNDKVSIAVRNFKEPTGI